MTKADIVNEIAKTTGIDKASVLAVVEQFMVVVKDSLAHGENVYLRGFGTFSETLRERIFKGRSMRTIFATSQSGVWDLRPASSSIAGTVAC